MLRLVALAATATAVAVACVRRLSKNSTVLPLCRLSKNSTVLPLRRFPASAPAADIAAALRADGVVVIEGVVPTALMDAANRELDDAGGRFYGAAGSFAGHHTVRNPAKPLGESQAARELAVNELVVDVVERVLGPWCKRVALATCSAITVEPPPAVGEVPAPPQVLHRDEVMWGCTKWPWLPASPEEGRPDLSVSVMWALSDFTAANGATRFLPGSNRWPRAGASYGAGGADLPDGVVDGEHTVQAEMGTGSVVLWVGGTLHGASSHAPRRADEAADASSARRGLLFIYNLGYLRPEHNFHFAIPLDVMKGSFGARLKDLIGLTGENANEHAWFVGPVYTQPYLGGPEGATSGNGVHMKKTEKRGVESLFTPQADAEGEVPASLFASSTKMVRAAAG